MSEVVIGQKELIAKFEALGEAVQGMALANSVQAGATVIVNAAKNNVKELDLIRTRNLGRSIHAEISLDGSSKATAQIGTDVEYAAIHEFGGTIRPKKGKYLAIPVGTYKDSPENHPRLTLRKTANGNLILVSQSGQIQYVLKTSVTIPAQPYLRPAIDEHENEAVDKVSSAFKQLILKAAGVA